MNRVINLSLTCTRCEPGPSETGVGLGAGSADTMNQQDLTAHNYDEPGGLLNGSNGSTVGTCREPLQCQALRSCVGHQLGEEQLL